MKNEQSYRCGFCEHPPFISKQAWMDHQIEAHPESSSAEGANTGFRVVPLFGPGLNPCITIASGDKPVASMGAVPGMALGFSMLMTSRQILDDWYLIRVFQEHHVSEDEALKMLRSLRAKRSGNDTQPKTDSGDSSS